MRRWGPVPGAGTLPSWVSMTGALAPSACLSRGGGGPRPAPGCTLSGAGDPMRTGTSRLSAWCLQIYRLQTLLARSETTGRKYARLGPLRAPRVRPAAAPPPSVLAGCGLCPRGRGEGSPSSHAQLGPEQPLSQRTVTPEPPAQGQRAPPRGRVRGHPPTKPGPLGSQAPAPCPRPTTGPPCLGSASACGCRPHPAALVPTRERPPGRSLTPRSARFRSVGVASGAGVWCATR